MEERGIHNIASAAEALIELIAEGNKAPDTKDDEVFEKFINTAACILWYLIERLALCDIIENKKVPNFYRVMLMYLLHHKYEHLKMGGLTEEQVGFEKNLDLCYISGKMDDLLKTKAAIKT